MLKFFLRLWTLTFVFWNVVKSKEVMERGGLIYKYEGNAQINQDYIQYSRLLDTSSLFNVAQRLKDSTTLYKTFCKTLSTEPTEEQEDEPPPNKYFHTPLKYPLKEAPGICQRHNGHLPEIRDKQSQNEIRSYANLHDINRIAAGIQFDQNFKLFQYMTDQQNARTNSPFSKVEYGGGYVNVKYEADWESDQYLVRESINFPLIYKNPASHFVLRLADKFDRDNKEHIMCESNVVQAQDETGENEQNWLTQLAIHACMREQNSVMANSEFTLMEINSVTTLNFSLVENEPDWESYFPKFIKTQAVMSPRKTRSVGFGWHIAVKNDEDDERWHKTSKLPTTSTTTSKPHQQIGQAKIYDPFPYEPAYEYQDYVIETSYPIKTIPDIVNALHAFWRIQHRKNFNKLTFPEWMKQQGQRQPIYGFLRNMPRIHRTERQIGSTIQLIQEVFAEGDIKSHPENQIRIGNYLETLDKLQEKHQHQLVKGFAKLLDKISSEPDISEEDENENYFIRKGIMKEIPNSTSTEHVIQKRAIPLILKVAGAAAMVGLTAAALSNTGSYVSSATANSPDAATLEIYRQNAKALSNLHINQNQITSAINAINKKLMYFEDQIIGKFEGVATIILEEDLRSFIQHLQTTIQITLLKYNAAMMSAADTRTSSYILSQEELEQIADVMMRTKNFQISRDLSNVKTYTLIENQQITFIFDIPITDDKKEFALYTISFLPTFHETLTLIPQVDSNHIAINSQGDKYTKLTELELNKCLDVPPRCYSHVPITPIRDESSCVATTYITDKPACDYKTTGETPRPTFLFYDNFMFYSVPTSTSVAGQCLKNTLSNGYKTGVVQLNGTGKIELSYTCVVNLPDGSTHNTPSRPSNLTQMNTPVFNHLKNLPQRRDFQIQGDVHVFTPQEPVTLLPEEPLDFGKVFKQSFHPAASLSTVTIIIICFAVFFCTFVSIYCFCPRIFLKCFCPERIYHLIDRRDDSHIREPSLNETPLDGANRTDSQWFNDSSTTDESSNISVRARPQDQVQQIREDRNNSKRFRTPISMIRLKQQQHDTSF